METLWFARRQLKSNPHWLTAGHSCESPSICLPRACPWDENVWSDAWQNYGECGVRVWHGINAVTESEFILLSNDKSETLLSRDRAWCLSYYGYNIIWSTVRVAGSEYEIACSIRALITFSIPTVIRRHSRLVKTTVDDIWCMYIHGRCGSSCGSHSACCRGDCLLILAEGFVTVKKLLVHTIVVVRNIGVVVDNKVVVDVWTPIKKLLQAELTRLALLSHMLSMFAVGSILRFAIWIVAVVVLPS